MFADLFDFFCGSLTQKQTTMVETQKNSQMAELLRLLKK